MRRGGTISEDLSLIVLLYNTNYMSKLKFTKTKNCSLTVKQCSNLQNNPTFHSEELFVRGRECFVGLSTV